MEALTPSSRNPISCKRGPEDRRPVLQLPRQPDAPSLLVLTLAPGITCEVSLPPRYKQLLLVALDAWRADEGEIETLRGFRTASEIGEHYAEFSNGGSSISMATVRTYVHDIKVRIARQVSLLYPHRRDDLRVPVLLEPRRVLGYRINRCGLEIVRSRVRVGFDT